MKKLLVMILAAMMLMLSACTNQEGGSETPDEGRKYTVGVVQLVQHAALDDATNGFVDELKKQLGDDVDIDVKNAAGDSATCATIAQGFVNNNVDLIMANATPALQAASSATGDIPVLGTSVTDYASALGIDNFAGATGINVSGTSDLPPLDEQAQMIMDLFPEANTVGIIYCSSEANSVYQVNAVQAYLEDKKIKVISASFTDSNDIAMVTSDLCSQIDVLYIPTDNTAASCSQTIAGVIIPAGIPAITGDEGTCIGCGVATLAISYYDLGVETGKMAAEVLKGNADISTLDIRYSGAPIKKYNKDICEQLGIDIPDDYVAIAG
ncbi:MAG: ABC transporter substrate-binding protein [Erysipelotrichaceae bacterium]|nr:ABC transporter substrate-binding protein [Erysipelotrichaceae bacterium]